MPSSVLISAGEASGDLYASRLVEFLRRDNPATQFFGCAGPRMRAAGVDPVVHSESLAVVGLVNLAIVSLVNLAILSTWLPGQLGGGQPYQLGHLINLVNLPI